MRKEIRLEHSSTLSVVKRGTVSITLVNLLHTITKRITSGLANLTNSIKTTEQYYIIAACMVGYMVRKFLNFPTGYTATRFIVMVCLVVYNPCIRTCGKDKPKIKQHYPKKRQQIKFHKHTLSGDCVIYVRKRLLLHFTTVKRHSFDVLIWHFWYGSLHVSLIYVYTQYPKQYLYHFRNGIHSKLRSP